MSKKWTGKKMGQVGIPEVQRRRRRRHRTIKQKVERAAEYDLGTREVECTNCGAKTKMLYAIILRVNADRGGLKCRQCGGEERIVEQQKV